MNRDFKKLLFSLFLISVPVWVWVAWQLVLPIEQYTFRGWESVIAGSHRWRSGFFPNQKLSMNEVGDLAPYTINAVPHRVNWQTDATGYRNSEAQCENPEVVIIGDSMAMGASLDQRDTITEQLGRDSKKCVRSFAGGKLYTAVDTVYSQGLTPKAVVLVLVERSTHLVDELSKVSFERRPSWLDAVPFSIAIPWSHFMKKFYWNYRAAHGVLAAIRRSFMTPEQAVALYAPRSAMLDPARPEVLFFGQTHNQNDTREEIQKLKSTLELFGKGLESRGSQLWVTFIPNKESIYYELQGRSEPQLGARLTEGLISPYFRYLDAIAIFKKDYQTRHELLHQSDDTHWNAAGVSLVSRALASQL